LAESRLAALSADIGLARRQKRGFCRLRICRALAALSAEHRARTSAKTWVLPTAHLQGAGGAFSGTSGSPAGKNVGFAGAQRGIVRYVKFLAPMG
jgi:hypothetical protein